MFNPAIRRRHWLAWAATSLIPPGWGGTDLCAQEATVAARPLAATQRADVAIATIGQLEPAEPGGRRPVVTALAVDPLGRWLAVAGDDLVVRLLETERLTELTRMVGHRDLVRSLDFRADGRALVSGGNDGKLMVWDGTRDWNLAGQWDELPPIHRARFSPDGRRLALVGFRSEPLLLGGESPQRLRAEGEDLRGLVINPQGSRLVIADRSGSLSLFALPTGEPIGRIETTAMRVRELAELPGSDRVVMVGEDGVITIVDLAGQAATRTISLLPCKLFAIAAIGRERIAVAGSDNRIRLVDCSTGQVVSHLDGHQGSISSLVHAGGFLYSGGFDTTVRKWSVASGQNERLAEKDRIEKPNR
ncbi:MAG: hypothetical protein EA381_16140 [Planctomycetaceae bacterium]|nr:MAG: hypothetical protein EA381_16140 [Planctomycetaceae bacterium]